MSESRLTSNLFPSIMPRWKNSRRPSIIPNELSPGWKNFINFFVISGIEVSRKEKLVVRRWLVIRSVLYRCNFRHFHSVERSQNYREEKKKNKSHATRVVFSRFRLHLSSPLSGSIIQDFTSGLLSLLLQFSLVKLYWLSLFPCIFSSWTIGRDRERSLDVYRQNVGEPSKRTWKQSFFPNVAMYSKG